MSHWNLLRPKKPSKQARHLQDAIDGALQWEEFLQLLIVQVKLFTFQQICVEGHILR